jgi:hypothetical protein
MSLPAWLSLDTSLRLSKGSLTQQQALYGKGQRLDSLPTTTGTTESVPTKVCQRAQSLGFVVSTELRKLLAVLQIEAPISLAASLTLTDECFLELLKHRQAWLESK